MSTTFLTVNKINSVFYQKNQVPDKKSLSDNLIIVTNSSTNVNNFFETISQELNNRYYDTNVLLNRQQFF